MSYYFKFYQNEKKNKQTELRNTFFDLVFMQQKI